MKTFKCFLAAISFVLLFQAPLPLSAAERKPRKQRLAEPVTPAPPQPHTAASAATNSAPALTPAPSAAGNEIKVVRPQPGEELTASEGYTFVIGTIPSDQYVLRCNGKLCDVSADGAFIGYPPIKHLVPPQTVDEKAMDAVFEFSAIKGKEKPAKTVYCLTPESPSSKKISTEKYSEPRVVESANDWWVGLENTQLPDGKVLLNLGKIAFFAKGCRFSVKEKKGDMFLFYDPIEKTSVWTSENDFKSVAEGIPSVIVTQEFTSERTPKSTIYHFKTSAPVPLICEESADRTTLRLRFLSDPPQAFVFPQPSRIWGFDTAYENGQTTVTVKYAPTINTKKPLENLKILIDPGHHPDTGALGPRGTEERTLTLLLSKQLAELLKSQGAAVTLSREDKPLDLNERCDKFREINPDLIVSIHFNSLRENEDPKIKWGTQSIYLFPHSMLLAKSIQRSLMSVVRGHDLSYVQRNLVVTRYPAAPAVLLEPTHIIMPDEEKRLLTPEYRDQLAKAISEGIINFLLGETPSTR